jgi:hypothetical protein
MRGLTRKALTRLVEDQQLYKNERATMRLEDVIERMKHQITITRAVSSPSATNGAFAISFTHSNPVTAQRVTSRLIAGFMAAHVAGPATHHTLELIDPANLPHRPLGLKTSHILLGWVAGLLGGILFSTFAARLRSGPPHLPA